jgi:DNA-binding CsgD family transcriptional regulator
VQCTAVNSAELRRALQRLDRAPDFGVAQQALKDIAWAIGMPVLAWSADVSRPSFNPHIDAFLRREGWPDEIMKLWWKRNGMLKNPLYVRCRTHALPFVTSVLDKLPAGRPELRQIIETLRRMEVESLITTPIHLPRGQVAMVTWGGPFSASDANELLSQSSTELLAAGHHYMHAYRKMLGAQQTREEDLCRLTFREWECLRLTAQGCREAEVASLIGLSQTTVRYHLDNVIRKLGASNRTHAVAIAAQLGILGPIS